MPKLKPLYIHATTQEEIREAIRKGVKQGDILELFQVKVPLIRHRHVRAILREMVDKGETSLRCECGKPYAHAGYCDKHKPTLLPEIERVITPNEDVQEFIANAIQSKTANHKYLDLCGCGRYYRKTHPNDQDCYVCKSDRRKQRNSLRAPDPSAAQFGKQFSKKGKHE